MFPDSLTQADKLLAQGHFADSIVWFNKAIADPKLGLYRKTTAYLSRAKAAEALAPKNDVALKNPLARRYALETHRWLQGHPQIPGFSETLRMNWETGIAQSLMLSQDGVDALRVGNQALITAGTGIKDRDLLQRMNSILAQVYERQGDTQGALKRYQTALQVAPKGVETPLVQQAVWELQGGNERLKPSDWDNLIARFPGNPYLPGLYGNYAAFLENKGDLTKLSKLAQEYHRKFDATTPAGSFDSCSIDWNLAMGHSDAKQSLVAYRRISELKTRCTGNAVGQLADQYLQRHPSPIETPSLALSGFALGLLASCAIFTVVNVEKIRRAG